MVLPFEVDRSYTGVVGVKWKRDASQWKGTIFRFVQLVSKDEQFGAEAIADQPILLVGRGPEHLVQWLLVAIATRFPVIAFDVAVSSTPHCTVIYSSEPELNPEGQKLPIGLEAAWKGCEPDQVEEVLRAAREGWNTIPK